MILKIRRKKYEVKTAELIPLPGQIDARPDSDASEDECIEQNKEDDTIQVKRIPRRAAQEARQKIAKLRHVQTNDHINRLPKHGYDYHRMLELDEIDDEETDVTSVKSSSCVDSTQSEPLNTVKVPTRLFRRKD